MRRTVDLILTFALSALGGLAAFLLGVPAGLLAGGALAVSVATLSGFRTAVPDTIRNAIFVLIGLMMGASVAPDSLTLVAQWPVTMAALVLELAVIVVLIGTMLRLVFRLDRGTAYLSSFPGHLSMIMALAASDVGDARKIVVIQVIRVMVLTLAVPVGALLVTGPLPASAVSPTEIMSVGTLAWLITGCAITGLVLGRLQVPAAYVIGPMAFAMATKLAGLYDGALHPWLVNVAFIAIGAVIGSRFGGVSRAELRLAVIAGLISTALTIAVVTGFAYGAWLLVDMPFGQIWIGLSPGALEAMGALGVALGYDTAFIAAHQVARLVLLGLAIPLIVHLVGRSQTPPDQSKPD